MSFSLPSPFRRRQNEWVQAMHRQALRDSANQLAEIAQANREGRAVQRQLELRRFVADFEQRHPAGSLPREIEQYAEIVRAAAGLPSAEHRTANVSSESPSEMFRKAIVSGVSSLRTKAARLAADRRHARANYSGRSVGAVRVQADLAAREAELTAETAVLQTLVT